MNGYFSELDEATDYEALDYEASDYEATDYSEARPRRPARPPVRTAPRASTYRTPAAPGTGNRPVTQQQLKAALANVAKQIGTNSNAIKTLDGRVRSVSTEQNRMGMALRKETADRKKDMDSVRGAIQETRTIAALLPLLTPQPDKQTVGGVANVLVDNSTGGFATIAPLLLLGNDLFGGASGSAGGTTGTSSGFLGGGTTGLIALLALTGNLGK